MGGNTFDARHGLDDDRDVRSLDDLLGFGRIGLGVMPLSTEGRPSRADAISTIAAALDAGIRHYDTADAYCLDAADTGHNEALLAEALGDRDRDALLVATKGGHVRDERGGWQTDGRPRHLADAARRSRDRLETECIDLYYFHRPDPAVPFQDSVEALAQLREDGVIRRVGVSNVDADQLRDALRIVPIAAVQNSFSPYDLSSAHLIPICEELGIAFVAWAPLGGRERAASLGEDEVTAGHQTRAIEIGASTAQVILAAVLDAGRCVIAIPGARRPSTVSDAARTTSLNLEPGWTKSLSPTSDP